MKVYHGTILSDALNIVNHGVDLKKSKRFLDFGRGFYTTPDYDMAKNMAKRSAAYKRTRNCRGDLFPTILTFEYKENSCLNIKKFYQEDIEWAKFVLYNRLPVEKAAQLNLLFNGNCEPPIHDIIIGGTADGDIARIASGLRYGMILPEEYAVSLGDFLKDDGKSYGTQIVFCTERALSCIECIKYDKIC